MTSKKALDLLEIEAFYLCIPTSLPTLPYIRIMLRTLEIQIDHIMQANNKEIVLVMSSQSCHLCSATLLSVMKDCQVKYSGQLK
jgi:hypothetical protein